MNTTRTILKIASAVLLAAVLLCTISPPAQAYRGGGVTFGLSVPLFVPPPPAYYYPPPRRYYYPPPGYYVPPPPPVVLVPPPPPPGFQIIIPIR